MLFSSHTHAQVGSRPAHRASTVLAYRVTSDERRGASMADSAHWTSNSGGGGTKILSG